MVEGVRLTRRAAKATAKFVEQSRREVPGTPRGDRTRRFAPGTRYMGVLLDTLNPAEDGQTSPTTAEMQVWLPDPDSTDDPVHMLDAQDGDEDLTITVVNRDSSLGGVAGAFIKVEFLNGEWSPYWVGCPA